MLYKAKFGHHPLIYTILYTLSQINRWTMDSYFWDKDNGCLFHITILQIIINVVMKNYVLVWTVAINLIEYTFSKIRVGDKYEEVWWNNRKTFMELCYFVEIIAIYLACYFLNS